MSKKYTNKDITKKKNAHKESMESEIRYKKIFNNKYVPMLVVNPETGLITDANPASTAFYGWSHSELTKMNIKEINMLSWSEIANNMQKAKNEKGKLFYFQHRLKDGSIRDVEVASASVEYGGKINLFSIIHDITDRKHQENLISEKQVELEVYAKKLEEMNTALNVLIDYRSQEKETFKNEMLKHFEKLVFPYFPTTKQTKTQAELSSIIEIIERNIKEILLKGDNKNLSLYIGLTPMEIQITQMIKDGKTSKGIANDLRMSVHTVYFHRENIRKKLNLTKSNINLKTYLQNHF